MESIVLGRWLSSKGSTVTARIKKSEQSVSVSVGSREFSVGCQTLSNDPGSFADFALFGLAALGMTHNLNVILDDQVSASAFEQVHKLGRIWELWASRYARVIYPLRLTATNIEPLKDLSPPPESEGGVLCMSGGVDSTFAALTAPPELKFRTGMLIAGADYPSLDDERFLALRERVSRICDLLGLAQVTVWTDIRRLKINYNMFHSLLLAMCLHYTRAAFSHGAFAADYTAEEECHVHPWGNNRIVAGALRDGLFPIHHLGGDHGRSHKVRTLMQDDRNLMELVSVCEKNISAAGNCGTCSKCIRTKLNIMTCGLDFSRGFVDKSEPVALLQEERLPRNNGARLSLEVFLHDIYCDLPEGEARVAVGRYLSRVRKANRAWKFSLRKTMSFH